MSWTGDMLRLARPGHWVKNLIVLLPVVSSLHVTSAWAWGNALLAAAAMCLASSAGYMLNDLCDRAGDQAHPGKKNRPLAAGTVNAPHAFAAMLTLAAGAILVASTRGMPLLLFVAAYMVLQGTYSLALKRKMLIDVICIAIGFVLRAGAGAVAIPVVITPWLIVCTFTICLFLGFCKRYNEISTLGTDVAAAAHRPILAGYTPQLLTHLITVSAAVAVVGFLLYATNPRTPVNHGGFGLVYTLPFIIYGIFRVAMLSMKGVYADPTDMILRDRPMQLTVILWVGCVMALAVWGQYQAQMPVWLRDLTGWP